MRASSRTAAYGNDGDRSRLERAHVAQFALQPREMSKAIMRARGRGFGARLAEHEGALYLVVEAGGPDDHRGTVDALNRMSLGENMLGLIQRACKDCPPSEPCVVELLDAQRRLGEFDDSW